MSERSIERHITIPEFGMVTVAPITNSNPADYQTPVHYAERMEQIGFEAWSQAPWMHDVVHGSSQHAAANVFNPNDKSRVDAREDMIRLRVDDDGEPVKFVGAFRGSTVSPESLLGFTTLQTEVSPTSSPEDDPKTAMAKKVIRGTKRALDATTGYIRPARVYDVIRNIQVDPGQQHLGIGSALLYGTLLNATPRRAVTSYVDVRNKVMQHFLERSMFAATNTEDSLQIDFQTLSGYSLQYLRYVTGAEDPYVTAKQPVVGRYSAVDAAFHIEHSKPWLKQATQNA